MNQHTTASCAEALPYFLIFHVTKDIKPVKEIHRSLCCKQFSKLIDTRKIFKRYISMFVLKELNILVVEWFLIGEKNVEGIVCQNQRNLLEIGTTSGILISHINTYICPSIFAVRGLRFVLFSTPIWSTLKRGHSRVLITSHYCQFEGPQISYQVY